MEQNIFNELLEALDKDDLVAFLGAGVSSTTDGQNGIPLAKDIVEYLNGEYGEVTKGSSNFEEACFLFCKYYNVKKLENIFRDTFKMASAEPMYSHKILSRLNFSAYITTNFDNLLEKSLANEKKHFTKLIDDRGVSLLKNIPYIKLHGCIDIPGSLKMFEYQYHLFEREQPLLTSLLQVILSNKTVLLLGYSLADADFKRIYFGLKKILKNDMPRIYAIVGKSDTFENEFWGSQGVRVIHEELNGFLKNFYKKVVSKHNSIIDNDWIHNSFFDSAIHDSYAPSEAALIKSFQDKLEELLCIPNNEVSKVMKSAEQAYENLISAKPGYVAFKNMYERLAGIRTGSDLLYLIQKMRACTKIRKLKMSEYCTKNEDVIEKGDKILLFAQSAYVTHLLRNVPSEIINTVEIFVCETRSKASNNYMGIPEIVHQKLTDSNPNFKPVFHFVQDMAVPTLMKNKVVNKVFVGAHFIAKKDMGYAYFANTVGTLMIVNEACINEVQIYVVAEPEKVIDIEDEHIKKIEAAELSIGKRNGISYDNYQFDICPFKGKITVISGEQHG